MKNVQTHTDQIRKFFAPMQSKEDLAKLLSFAGDLHYGKKMKPVQLQALNYYANPKICKKRYEAFTIKKKSGEDRIIHAPVNGLKYILQALNVVLQHMYVPHISVTGFAKQKSIVDNAQRHIGYNYVYNLDLKDFFYSFDRNRVKLGFMGKPFHLNKGKEPLAFFLAGLCTHPLETDEGIKIVLPQGSPASPVLTNILCSKLDQRLKGLADRFGAIYSRYADDITFSSPHNIYHKDEFLKELRRIIEDDQKLAINPNKTRLQKAGYRQETTGLIVNEKVNVRRIYVKEIRMWLHYWEKYGYEKATEIFHKDANQKSKADLEKVLEGKLQFMEMVKGSKDDTVHALKKRLKKLKKDNIIQKPSQRPTTQKKQEEILNSHESLGIEGVSSNSSQKSHQKSTDSDSLPEYFPPINLYNFLFEYNQNPILKSTCHEIGSEEVDIIKKYCKTDDYIFEAHLKKIIEAYETLTKNHRDHPVSPNIYTLILAYLTGKNRKGEEKKWSSDNITTNWSHKAIKDWAHDHSNTAPNSSDNIFKEKDTTSPNIEPAFISKLTEKPVVTFYELTLHFKSLFHIRSNSLLDLLRIINEKCTEEIDFTIAQDKFPKNIELFTDVDKVTQAYKKLIDLIIECHEK